MKKALHQVFMSVAGIVSNSVNNNHHYMKKGTLIANNGNIVNFKQPFKGINMRLLSFIMLLFCGIFINFSNVYSQTASATWALTTDGSVANIGNVTGSAQALNNLYTPSSSAYSSSGQRTSPRYGTGSPDGGWPGDGTEVSNRYMEFSVQANSGSSFSINSITGTISVNSGSSIRFNSYYSTDPTFATKTPANSGTLGTSATSIAITITPNVTIQGSQKLYFRIYPYTSGSTTGKYVVTKGIVISGTTAVACTGSTTAPTITSTTLCAAGTTVSGTSSEVDGTAITVYKAGTTSIGTTTVSSGAWTATVAALTAADVVTAVATKTGNCSSSASGSVTVQSVATAPAITTSGICPSTTSIAGTSSEAVGSTITVYKAGATSLGTALVVTGGTWTATGLTLTAGDVLTAAATSVSGKCASVASASVTVQSITATPVITSSICNGVTTVSGTSSETSGTVTILKNGNSIGTATISSGVWSKTSISPALSSTTPDVITATALTSGKCTSGIATVTIQSISAAPVVTTGICAGATSVSGTSSEANGTTITILKGGSSIGTASVSSNAWTLSSISPALAGADVITATASAANKCTSATSTSVTVQSVAATPIVTSPICTGATQVLGTCSEANGSTITIFKGGTSLGTTTITSNSWSKTVAALSKGDVVTAQATTVSGKCASVVSSSVTVADCAAPTITLTNGTASPTLYTGNAMSSIQYTWGGSATTASVTWTGTTNSSTPPSGITVANSSNPVVISGTPTVAGTYGYTITTDGTSAASLTGTITVVTKPVVVTSNTAIGAQSLPVGSTGNIITNFSLTVSANDATLTGVSLPISVSGLVTGDLVSYNLYFSASSSTFSNASLIATVNSALATSPISFTGFNTTIHYGSTGNFWITTDVNASATIGHSLTPGALSNTTNLTFNTPVSISGTIAASSPQTISANTYTWKGTTNDYQVSTNWTPTRTSPAASDILQFNSGTTVTVTNVNTETVASLLVSTANTNVTLQASTAATLSVTGTLTTALNTTLSLGTTVNITSSAASQTIAGTLNIGAGTTYSTSTSMAVSGTVNVQATGLNSIATVGGSSNGTLTITGSAALSVTGTLSVRGYFLESSSVNVSITGSGVSFADYSVCELNNASITKAPTPASWTSNSNLLVTTIAGCSDLLAITDTYGNFNFNFSGAGTNHILTSANTGTLYIAGNFKVTNSGTGKCKVINGASNDAITFHIGGDLNLPSGAGIFQLANNSSYTSLSLIIDGNVNTLGSVWSSASTSPINTIDFHGTNKTINCSYGFSGISTITVSGSYTLNRNLAPTASATNFKVTGTLDCGNFTITGSSNNVFTLAAGATLKTANSAGIAGSILTYGTQIYTAGANYEFDGNTTTPLLIPTLTLNTSGTAAASQKVIPFSNTAGIIVGMQVTGTNIPLGSKVSSISTNVSVTLNNSIATGGIASSAAIVFGNVDIPNNITIGANVTLNYPVTLSGSLIFNSGILTTTSTNLPTIPVGSVSGASTTSYISGPLAITSAASLSPATLTFPIGSSTYYSPVTLNVTQTAATANTYTASVSNTVASKTLPSGFISASTTRSYSVTTSGTNNISAASIGLVYDATDGNSLISNASALRILNSEGGSTWVNEGPSAGASSGTITSDVSFTKLGSFTLGKIALVGPTLTAATSATVDNDFTITFTDNSTWRAGVTAIKVGTNSLPSSAYDLTTSGQITLKPSKSSYLQTAGTYTITISSTGYVDKTVSQIIGAGVPTQLVVNTAPASPLSNGSSLATQPVVYVEDQYNNLTSTDNVTASVGSGTWTIGGTTTVAAAAGVVAFTDLTATSAAAVTGATITFTDGTLTVTSTGFDLSVNQTPTLNSPSTTPTVDNPYTINITNDISLNNYWQNHISSITVTINSSTNTLPSSAYDLTVPGQITFDPSQSSYLQKAGSYSFNVNVSNYNAATLNNLVVGAGADYQLAVTTEPESKLSKNAAVFTSHPVVQIWDKYNNITGSTSSISVTINGTNTAINAGTTTTTTAGEATFSALNALTTDGSDQTGVTLTFTSGSLVSATTTSFEIPAFATTATDYFKSNSSGDWATNSTWLGSWDNLNWFNATAAPTSSATMVTILNNHNITISTATTVGNTTVADGGKLTVQKVLTVAGSTILTISPDAGNGGGTLEYQASTASISNSPVITGSLKVYGNYIVNPTTVTNIISGDQTSYLPITNTIYGSASVVTIKHLPSSDANFRINGSIAGTVVVDVPSTEGATSYILFNPSTTTLGALTIKGTGIGYIAQGTGGTGRTINITNDLTISGGSYSPAANSSNVTSTLNVAGNLYLSGGTLAASSSSATNSSVINLKGTVAITGGTLTGYSGTGTGGAVLFNGTVAQSVSASGTYTIGSIVISNASGVNLTSNLTISGKLTLTTGVLTSTSTNLLSLAAGATIAGGSNTSYVSGPVQNTIATGSATAIVFPIGKSGSYSPVTLNITQKAATVTTYTAEVFVGGTTPTNTLPSTISTISTNRYYTLSSSASNINTATIKLVYDATDATGNGMSVNSPSNIKIAGSNAGNWVDLNQSVFGVSGSITSDVNFTSLENFVLGNSIVKKAAPSLGSVTGATVDAPINITITNYDANWTSATHTISFGTYTLAPADYVLTTGNLQLIPSATNGLGVASTHTLTITASGYDNAVLSSLTIGAGVPATLAIKTTPVPSATNGAAFTTQPIVYIQDKYGNSTTSTANVTASATSTNAYSWTLGGTATVAGIGGTVTFSTLKATSETVFTNTATITFTCTVGLNTFSVTSSPFSLTGPNTYTWVGGNAGSSNGLLDQSNWSLLGVGGAAVGASGTAITFLSSDILVFDGTGISGTIAVPAIASSPAISIGRLLFKNSANVTWNAGGSRTVTINGGADAFDIDQTSSFSLGGSGTSSGSAITINLLTGSTANIYGTLSIGNAANTSQTSHSFNGADKNSITFYAGATAIYNLSSSSSPFGTGTAGSVVFNKYSKLKGIKGGDIFGGKAVIVFNSHSTYEYDGTSSSYLPFANGTAAQSYSNFVINNNTNALTPTATANFTVDSLTLSATATNPVTINLATKTLNINDALSNLNTTNAFTIYNSTTGTSNINMTGTSAQSISSAAGGLVIGYSSSGKYTVLNISNAAGVSLSNDLSIIGTLNISSGNFSIGSNTLTVGNITGAGNLVGSATSNINITGSGTAGTTSALGFANGNTLGSLTISGANTATLGNDLGIAKLLSLSNSSAKLDIHGHKLTLKSSASGTAEVANMVGSVVDGTKTASYTAPDGTTVAANTATNITVERYIPKFNRNYRDLGPSVAHAGSVFANWQEGGIGSPSATYGIFITGKTGYPGYSATDAATGFDLTTNGNTTPSLYNCTNGNWTPITTTSSNTGGSVKGTKGWNLDPYQGLRVLVRGGRNFNMGTNPSSMPTATTIRATGQLVTGDVTFNAIGKGGTVSSAYTSTYGLTAPSNYTVETGTSPSYSGGWSFITNPYACPVSWSSILNSTGVSAGLYNTYYFIDPNFQNSTPGNSYGLQRYITVQYTTVNGAIVPVFPVGGSTTASNYLNIQPGQGFWVYHRTLTSSLSSFLPKVVIQESNKMTGQTQTAVFRTMNTLNMLSASIWKDVDGVSTHLDGAIAIFNNNNSKSIGEEDAMKLMNSGENIFINELGNDLSIDGLTLPSANDEIALKLGNVIENTAYTLKVDATNFTSPGLQAFIKDGLTNTEVPVEMQ